MTLNSNDMETLMQTTLYSPAAARRMWLETNALVIEQGRQILLMSMIVSGGQAFKLPARILPPGCEQVLYDEMLPQGGCIAVATAGMCSSTPIKRLFSTTRICTMPCCRLRTPSKVHWISSFRDWSRELPLCDRTTPKAPLTW